MSLIDSRKIKNFITMNAIYIVLILLIIGIAFVDPRFLSIVCLRDILIQSSTRVIIALGIFFIILTGGVDLSAGRQVGLAASDHCFSAPISRLSPAVLSGSAPAAVDLTDLDCHRCLLIGRLDQWFHCGPVWGAAFHCYSGDAGNCLWCELHLL